VLRVRTSNIPCNVVDPFVLLLSVRDAKRAVVSFVTFDRAFLPQVDESVEQG
jgi:hypothetical protein